MKNAEVFPIEFDHMPEQVATELLANPRAKLTARMRKNCKLARAKIFQCNVPLRRDENRKLVEALNLPEPHERLEKKLVKKFTVATWQQLIKWNKRLAARRMTVQQEYLRIKPDEKNSEIKRAALEAVAERIDFTRDCLEIAIHTRKEKTKQ